MTQRHGHPFLSLMLDLYSQGRISTKSGSSYNCRSTLIEMYRVVKVTDYECDYFFH